MRDRGVEVVLQFLVGGREVLGDAVRQVALRQLLVAPRDDGDDLFLLAGARRALGFVALALGFARLALLPRFALQAPRSSAASLKVATALAIWPISSAAAERGNLGFEVAGRQAEHGVAQLAERLGGGAPDEDRRSEAAGEREKNGAEDDFSGQRFGRREPRARRLALGRHFRVEVAHDRADHIQGAAHSLGGAHEIQFRGAGGLERLRIVLEAGAKRVFRLRRHVRALERVLEPAVADLPLARQAVVEARREFRLEAAHGVQRAEHALGLDRVLVGDGRLDAIGQRVGAAVDAIEERARTGVAERRRQCPRRGELLRNRVDFDLQGGNLFAEVLAARRRGEGVDALGQFLRAVGELLQVGRFASEADVAAGGLHLDRRSGDFARFLLQLRKRLGVRERGGDPAAADEIDASDDDQPGDEGDADQSDADLDRQQIEKNSHASPHAAGWGRNIVAPS